MQTSICFSFLFRVGLAWAAVSAAFGQTQRCALTTGWDGFNEPLASGEVRWQMLGPNTLDVVFDLRGARPNHTYGVGCHHMASSAFSVPEFLGRSLGTSSGAAISREGRSAHVIAYEFGKLTTDAQGNGSAQFSGPIPSGTYRLQFNVRLGECDPTRGMTSGCAAVYRTGGKFAANLETISCP